MFRVELGKIMTNVAFYLCIASVVALLLAGELFVDATTGEEFNIVNLLMSDNASELMEQHELHATDVIVRGVGGYLDMFTPIIVAVPFIMIVCGEKKNSNARFEIYRVGKNRFLFGKFLAAIVSGGLALMIGYMIFSGLIFAVLPGKTGTLMEIQYNFWRETDSFHKWFFDSMGAGGMIGLKFLRMFVYGAVSAVPAFGLSMFIKNRYIIISIPFMFFYLFDKFAVKQNIEMLLKSRVANISNALDPRVKDMALIFGIAIVVIVALCRVYLGRKCDCGEE